MNTTEVFLIAIIIIYTVPYLVCRLGKTDYYAPLVVIQIITGVLLGLVSWLDIFRLPMGAPKLARMKLIISRH